jgi:cysteine synthase A
VRRGHGRDRHGRGEFLKHRNPRLKVVACEPQASAVLSGGRRAAPHPGHRRGLRAARAQPRAARRGHPGPDEAAIETARLAARTEGLLVGISCGAALWGALQLAARPEYAGARSSACCPTRASATSRPAGSPTDHAARGRAPRRAPSRAAPATGRSRPRC